MEINIYGVIIFCVFLPISLLLVFLKPVRRIKIKPHKQITTLNLIGELGASIFGLVTFEGIGYHIVNKVLFIIWIVLLFILLSIYYLLYIRFLKKKRYEDYLYDKVIIYAPISLIKPLIYLLSGALMFNPIVIGFSISYLITSYYLGIKRYK